SFDRHIESLFNNRLTIRARAAPFAPPFQHHVESLHHHRIETHARQHHSPARYGQEKGRRRPPRDQNGAASVRAEPAPASDLGAGVEEIRASARDRAWAEDDQQKRCLQSVEKSWRDLAPSRTGTLTTADFRFFRSSCRGSRRGARLLFWFGG